MEWVQRRGVALRRREEWCTEGVSEEVSFGRIRGEQLGERVVGSCC